MFSVPPGWSFRRRTLSYNVYTYDLLLDIGVVETSGDTREDVYKWMCQALGYEIPDNIDPQLTVVWFGDIDVLVPSYFETIEQVHKWLLWCGPHLDQKVWLREIELELESELRTSLKYRHNRYKPSADFNRQEARKWVAKLRAFRKLIADNDQKACENIELNDIIDKSRAANNDYVAVPRHLLLAFWAVKKNRKALEHCITENTTPPDIELVDFLEEYISTWRK